MRYKWINVTTVLVAGILFAQAGCQNDESSNKASTKGASATQSATQPASAPASMPAPATQATLVTPKDKISYSLGVEMAKNLRLQGVDLNMDVVAAGLKDAMANGTLLMNEQERLACMDSFRADYIVKQGRNRLAAALDNKKEGEEFLAANKTKEGVVALPSGLQYKVIKAGNGPKPADTDIAVCNYRGTLINGKEFDSSYRLGKPAAFPVASVIAGWREALKLMPVGSKWQLFIPSQLAYLGRGMGRDIGPNTTLIFEVELVGVQKPGATQ